MSSLVVFASADSFMRGKTRKARKKSGCVWGNNCEELWTNMSSLLWVLKGLAPAARRATTTPSDAHDATSRSARGVATTAAAFTTTTSAASCLRPWCAPRRPTAPRSSALRARRRETRRAFKSADCLGFRRRERKCVPRMNFIAAALQHLLEFGALEAPTRLGEGAKALQRPNRRTDGSQRG